mmetsp:Transcript_29541/g.98720  ORF Transcript_29541/g.98720 Transcript_29541/m.98720 type:complete len:221 (+) Transcript_29541:1337-1999(+)
MPTRTCSAHRLRRRGWPSPQARRCGITSSPTSCRRRPRRAAAVTAASSSTLSRLARRRRGPRTAQRCDTSSGRSRTTTPCLLARASPTAPSRRPRGGSPTRWEPTGRAWRGRATPTAEGAPAEAAPIGPRTVPGRTGRRSCWVWAAVWPERSCMAARATFGRSIGLGRGERERETRERVCRGRSDRPFAGSRQFLGVGRASACMRATERGSRAGFGTRPG